MPILDYQKHPFCHCFINLFCTNLFFVLSIYFVQICFLCVRVRRAFETYLFQEIYEQIDKNNDGTIVFEEFVTVLDHPKVNLSRWWLIFGIGSFFGTFISEKTPKIVGNEMWHSAKWWTIFVEYWILQMDHWNLWTFFIEYCNFETILDHPMVNLSRIATFCCCCSMLLLPGSWKWTLYFGLFWLNLRSTSSGVKIKSWHWNFPLQFAHWLIFWTCIRINSTYVTN